MTKARPPAETDADDLTELTYEQARDQLVNIVNRLETGGATLEESLALWERGEQLVVACEAFLARARERIEAARGGNSSGPE